MHEMSPRERFLRTMNFEPADRLPIMMNWLTASYVQGITGLSEEEYWANQIGAHARAFKILGVDFCQQLAFPPREESQRTWAVGEVDRWFEPDAVAADMEGQITQWDHVVAGPLEEQREEHVREICDYQTDRQKRLGEDCFYPFAMEGQGPWGLGFPLGYGYEGFCLTVAIHPDVVEHYWQAGSRVARWHNECIVEAARRINWPKIGYLGSDMTTQTGNIISPAVMVQRFFPHLDHALEPLVKAGFKLIWHSDGNMNHMIDPLIDVGVAGFQGFQEECGTRIVEVAKRRARNGDPLILWGSVSAVDVVRNGTFDDIRREVQRVLDEWPYPGLCLATASAMMDDVPHANITEMYRLFRTLGVR
jgi:hypothetical protein